MAKDVTLTLQTGKTMNMNNPVSKVRLQEMYDELRTSWPKIKQALKSNNENPESVKELIQVHYFLMRPDIFVVHTYLIFKL